MATQIEYAALAVDFINNDQRGRGTEDAADELLTLPFATPQVFP